jgi:serine/threonine protein kinase/tetratricopeptide (TPR) repeat protein
VSEQTRIKQWLDSLGLDQYLSTFVENDIDNEILLTLNTEDLREMGITSLGHRKRMLAAISQLEQRTAVSAQDKSATQHSSSEQPIGLVAPHEELNVSAKRTVAVQVVQPRSSENVAVNISEVLENLANDDTRSQRVVPVYSDASGVWDNERQYQPGDVIADRFELIRKLGTGGMGEVFLARQQSVDRMVAIKLLHAEQRHRTDLVKRFVREANAVATLCHPNIVQLYDFIWVSPSEACMVMELVEGRSLEQMIAKESPVPLAQAIEVAVQVCDALAGAHSAGVIHRDLKPGNIFLLPVAGQRNFVKVLDFGIARVENELEPKLTVTGDVFGTPRYMSPEQIMGNTTSVQSDLYSLGIILFEMLAGQPPFNAAAMAVMAMHLNEPVPTLPADVARPPALDVLLRSMLAKSPSLRPGSALQVRDELLELLEQRAAPVVGRSSYSVMPPANFSAEWRQSTVISMELYGENQWADTEQEHQALSEARAHVRRLVTRFEGHLLSAQGRFVQVVFGAWSAHRNDPHRAVQVALLFRQSASQHGQTWQGRAGIVSGRVIVSCEESHGKRELVVSGPPIQDANNVCQQAQPGDILISDEVYRETTEQFNVAPRTNRDAKEVWAVQTHRQKATWDSSDIMVGRIAELQQCVDAMNRCLHRQTGVTITVCGEAGMGKSRLVSALRKEAIEKNLTCHEGQFFDRDEARQQDVFRSVLHSVLGISNGEDTEQLQTAVESVLASSGLGPEHWVFLYDLVGLALPMPMRRVFDAMEPSVREFGKRHVLVTVLRNRAIAKPFLITLEDVHWADRSALSMLAGLHQSIATVPIVLIVTTREDRELPWEHSNSDHETLRINLSALSDEMATELVARLGVEDKAWQRQLVERAGGHPLFLVELLRSQHKDSTLMLPASVQSLIQIKLDKLAAKDRQAIQAAAILGKQFRLETLRSMVKLPDYSCAKLVAQRLLVRCDSETFAFAHALVHEAIYDQLLEKHRKQLHLQAFENIKEINLQAQHLAYAGDARAAGVLIQVAHAEIKQHAYHRALRFLQLSAEVPYSKEEGFQLHSLEGEVLLVLGEGKLATDAHGKALECAQSETERCQALIHRASAARGYSNYELALADLDAAESILQHLNEPKFLSEVKYLRGSVSFATGRVEASRAAHLQALELANQHDLLTIKARVLSGMADSDYGIGKLRSAHDRFQQSIEIGRVHGLLSLETNNLGMLALTKVFLLAIDESLQVSEQALNLASELSQPRAETLALGSVALAMIECGNYQGGLEVARQAKELARRVGMVIFETAGLYFEARSNFYLNKSPQARELMTYALKITERNKMGRFMAAALYSVQARATSGVHEQNQILQKGIDLLNQGVPAFNHLWLYREAIEIAWEQKDFPRMLTYANALASFTAQEPFPWADFVVERGRVLAEVFQDNLDPEIRQRLRIVSEQASKHKLQWAIPALEQAKNQALL